MATVQAGSFDVKGNRLLFCATGKQDNVSSIFEREVGRLNEMVEMYEGTFVSVCANKSTVFVAINTLQGWALIFEIDATRPVKFETIEDKFLVAGKHDQYFGSNARVQMMCCAGEDQAALLITNDENYGSVWLRIFSVSRQSKIWVKCPVNYNDRDQCIAMIACAKTHCAALTNAGDVFTCVFPSSEELLADSPTWILSEKLTAFDTGDPREVLQKIVDDIDSQVLYKRRCPPMAASFGVTGALSNPYMINFTTDGELAEKLEKEYKDKQKDLGDKFKKQFASHLDESNRLKKQAEKHTKEVQELEEKIVNHQRKGEEHELHLQNAREALQEAQKLHSEALNSHAAHKSELNRLNSELHAKVKGVNPVDVHTRSTNPHQHPQVDNTGTDPSKSKSMRFGLNKAFKKIFGKTSSRLENELNFEDVAHLSANRETRCTYI